MRWMILDEVIKIKKGKSAVARSHVPSAEFSAEVLMVEMMAQTGALILGAESDFQSDVVFAKIETSEFDPPYESGNPVFIEASSEQIRPEGAWIDAVIRTSEKGIARARLLLTQVKLQEAVQESSVTFHEAFMNHYQIRNKIQ